MFRTSHPGRFKKSPEELAKDWIASKLSEYYKQASLILPENLSAREFAYQPIGSKSYVRHLSFKSAEDLRKYVVQNPPLHLFYSSAIYTFPEINDMEKKGMVGSELIFDIDADEVKGCEYFEQMHICRNCGYVMYGKSIKKCIKCGSTDVVDAEPIPGNCIKNAARETKKLVKILRKDFGFSEVKVYFSGNRGFHVRPVCDEGCLKLSSEERAQIVKYIKGDGLSIERILLSNTKRKKNLIIPAPDEPGWRGRIGEIIYNKMGMMPSKKITLEEAKSKLGNDIDFAEIVKEASVDIDEKVTIDVHRLIRIPNSINGKLGFPVLEIPESELENFYISCNLSPFKEKTEIQANFTLENKVIMGEKVDLIKGDRITVPGCIAFLLISRGLAIPVM